VRRALHSRGHGLPDPCGGASLLHTPLLPRDEVGNRIAAEVRLPRGLDDDSGYRTRASRPTASASPPRGARRRWRLSENLMAGIVSWSDVRDWVSASGVCGTSAANLIMTGDATPSTDAARSHGRKCFLHHGAWRPDQTDACAEHSLIVAHSPYSSIFLTRAHPWVSLQAAQPLTWVTWVS
jgi:hypothetical protein